MTGRRSGEREARRAAARWLCQVVAAGAPAPCPEILRAAVVSIAREHRLDACAGSALARPGRTTAVPDGLAPLVDAWRRTLGEQALWNDLSRRLDAELARRGVCAALLKGADLAGRLYRPGERPHNDLDLLVEPAAVREAGAALAAAGLEPDHPDPGFAARHWFATTWRDAARPRLQVDLHWGLGPRGRVAWTAREVLERALPFPGHVALARLDPLDLVVHLALHAVAFHGATGRWIWWLDVHRARAAVADGEALAARAEAAGGAVALAAALARAETLFGPVAGAVGPARARRGALVARVGAALERDGRSPRLGGLGRRLVAAAAIDRPSALGVAAWDVVRRSLVPGRTVRDRRTGDQ